MEQKDVKYGFVMMKIWIRCRYYVDHRNKTKILLWCYTGISIKKCTPKSTLKRSSKLPTDTRRSSNYDSQLKTADEVNIIFQSLKEEHGGEYTPEQLRTWAHMLHIGTHDSTQDPPDKPFSRFSKLKHPDREELVSTPEAKKAAVSHSPGRRVNMRSELIDQLKKCSELVDSGAISDEIFHDLQTTILSDIKNL